jgi:hypothetical protein
MKLNGWKRIGVVASVVWILGAGFYTLHVINEQEDRYIMTLGDGCEQDHLHEVQQRNEHCYRLSLNAPDFTTAYNKCTEDFQETTQKTLDACWARVSSQATAEYSDWWIEVLAVAFIPLPFGWGVIYLVLFVVRWVTRGFMRPSS